MMKNKIKYIKEAIKLSKTQLIAAVSVFLSIWGVLNVFFNQSQLWWVLFVCGIVLLIVTLAIIGNWYYKVVQGSLTVTILQSRKVTLIRNNFEVNAAYLFSHLPKTELEELVLVMGIDRIGLLDVCSANSVAYDLLKWLEKNYNFQGESPTKEIQRQIDDYCENTLKTKEFLRLPYGTCIEVRMKLTSNLFPEEEPTPCNLLMIANTRKKNYENSMMKEALADDKTANNIIPDVFKYLQEVRHYKSVMVGVMGSNNVGQPYQVVFSQIINQFARVCIFEQSIQLNHLYISIREEDYYNRWNLSLAQLESYLQECSKYYQKNANEKK